MKMFTIPLAYFVMVILGIIGFLYLSVKGTLGYVTTFNVDLMGEKLHTIIQEIVEFFDG